MVFFICVIIGIIHEHQRSDRNENVFINFDNVDKGADGHFWKYTYTTENEEDLVRCNSGMSNEEMRSCWNGGWVENLDVYYDKHSLVHYGGPMFEHLQDSDYPDQTFGGAEKVQKSDHWKCLGEVLL